MKRKVRLIAIILCVVFGLILLGGAIYLTVIDVTSRECNLIKLSNSDKEPTVSAPSFEGDVELSTGIRMHYATYGSAGEPLILIHGNGGSHKRLEELAFYFADEYTVYAIDSRCQGESSHSEKLSYKLMASDVNAFCQKLQIKKPLVIGHSDGGIVALQTAMDYPDLMRAFVSCGANSSPKAFKPYFTLPIKLRYLFKPVELDRIMIEEPSFSETDLAKITCPAYIVAGEFDIMWLSDSRYLAENIKNSQIAIIKWGGHSYIREGAKGYTLCKPFFDSLPKNP